MNKAACIAGVLLAVGCGGGFDVSDQVLTGEVGGQSWTFITGYTDSFLSEGEDDFFAILYAEDFEPCGFDDPDTDHLIVAVPKQTGEYEFDLGLNMTFVVEATDGPENFVSFEGGVIVDEVTATTVRGGLSGEYDGDNHVNGRFELTICNDN